MQNRDKQPEDNPLLDFFDLCDVASTYDESSITQTNDHSVSERDRSPNVRLRQECVAIQPINSRLLTIIYSNILNYNYPIAKPECIECIEEKRNIEKLLRSQAERVQFQANQNYKLITPSLIPVSSHILANSSNIKLPTNSSSEAKGVPPPFHPSPQTLNAAVVSSPTHTVNPSLSPPFHPSSTPSINSPPPPPQVVNSPLPPPPQSTSIPTVNPLYQNSIPSFSGLFPIHQSSSIRPKELSRDHPLVQFLIKYYSNNVSIKCHKCGNITFIGYLFKMISDNNPMELICFNCSLDPSLFSMQDLNKLKPFISIDSSNNVLNDNNDLIKCLYCKKAYHPICYVRYLSNHYTLSQICLLCNVKYRRYNNSSHKQPKKVVQKPLLILPPFIINNINYHYHHPLRKLLPKETKEEKEEKEKKEKKEKEGKEEKEEKEEEKVNQQNTQLKSNLNQNVEKCAMILEEVDKIKLKEERLKKKNQILKINRRGKKKK